MEGVLLKKVDVIYYEVGRDLFWKYSLFMFYVCDVDLENWNYIIQIYQDMGYLLYKGEFQIVIGLWCKNV